MNYTDAQNKAIEQGRHPAIVSAGAGSGKTAVLTQRVVRMVCDRTDPLDPSKIAVVTFTDKAAGELRARLDKLMRERTADASNADDVLFIRRQRNRLRKARISTISSFCFTLIRENIDLAKNLAAGFSIMDETRAGALKNAVLDDVLEDFYLNADSADKDIILENYIQKNDAELRNIILFVHAKSLNHTDPEGWLSRSDDAGIQNNIKLRLIEKVRYYAKRFDEEISAMRKAIECYEGSNADKHAAYADTLENVYGKAIKELIQNNCCFTEEITALSQTKFDKAPPDRSNEKLVGAHRKAAKSIFEDNIYKTCLKISSFDDDMSKSLPAVTVLKELVIKFGRRYAEEKRSRNCADFSDAERELYGILSDNPEVGKRIGLQLIIVDEFQDSNRLQYEIFRHLSDKLDGLYFVGDIKQSIYGFRGAQPEVFSEICASPGFDVLPLNENFRSGRSVIDGINTLFDRMMTEKTGGVDYEKNGRLVCGLDKDGTAVTDPDDMTEVCIITPYTSVAAESEAEYVASRIRGMIDSGYKVGKEKRPCTEDDFAIIMRSPANKAEIYAQAVKSQGLGVTFPQKDVFTECPEIRIMLSLLKVINDPYDDISLAKVLMSPLYCFTAEEMARLRTGTFGFDIPALEKACPEELERYSCDRDNPGCMKKKPLYSCLRLAAYGYDTSAYPVLASLTENIAPSAKCIGFLSDLDGFRDIAAASSPHELIRIIYDTISAPELLSVGDDPVSKQANLELLISYAREYCDFRGGGTISDFIENIENMGGSLKAAAFASSHGVKIMSVHASKGLQFPVVFVSDCARKFNPNDYNGDIIISEEYGISTKSVDISTMSKIPSPAYHAASLEIKAGLFSEEMRLLYVAATRAENKLIFTGTKKIADKEYDKLDIAVAGRKKAKCNDANYLLWLLEVLSCECDRVDDRKRGIIKYGDVKYEFYPLCESSDGDDKTAVPECAVSEVTASNEAQRADDNDDVDAGFKAAVKEVLSRHYEYEPLTVMPSKFTATELAANLRERYGGESYGLYIGKPSFLTEKQTGRLSGKRRGDAYHKLMEHIPLDKVMSAEMVQAYIENTAADLFTVAEKKSIDPADIAKFFESDIAKRIITAAAKGNVYREYPIFHKLDAGQYDPAIFGVESKEALIGAEPYVQGIADMFFIEDGEIVLIDYKSDRTDVEQTYIDDYKLQLDIYRQALEQEFSMPVKQMLIYSFTLGHFIDTRKGGKITDAVQ